LRGRVHDEGVRSRLLEVSPSSFVARCPVKVFI
jgi:hypothetical protein